MDLTPYEWGGAITDMVSDLPDPQAMIVILTYLRGWTISQAAAYLGIQVGAAAHHLAVALRSIAREIEAPRDRPALVLAS